MQNSVTQAQSSSKKSSGLPPVVLLLFVIAFVIFNLVMGFWFISPYMAVSDLQKAAQAGDVQTLSKLMDAAAVRNSVSEELKDPAIIDMVVSPSGITNLFECSNLVSDNADLTGSPANVDASTGCQTIGISPEVEPNSIAKNDYASLDKFVAYRGQKYSGQGVSFILARTGLLSWKLVEIDFHAPESEHVPVYFVGYSTGTPLPGISQVKLYDRLLAINGKVAIDYPSVVEQFKAAGNAAEISVLRSAKVETFMVAKEPEGKFGFVLSGYVSSPLEGVASIPVAAKPEMIVDVLRSRDPQLVAKLVQAGRLALIQPDCRVLRGEVKQMPIGANGAIAVMHGRVLEGSMVTGPNGLHGRNFWMLNGSFPAAPPPVD